MDTSLDTPLGHRASTAHDDGLNLLGLWQRWRQRLRTRAELRAMDARALADIGMDPESARQEVRTFFWQG